jgi:hypothetical protein
MSGGVWRVRRDGVKDYLPLRREAFGFELAPLPRSLQLSPAEARLNRGPTPARAGEPATTG